MALPIVLASPFPSVNVPSNAGSITRRQALSTPAPSSISSIDPNTLYQGEYVVTLVNSHTTAITTAHNQNAGAPIAIHDNRGVLEVNATAILAVPTGWAGRVAIAEAEYTIRDRASLLEGSFISHENAEARIFLDVSYVDAFTVPITCECEGEVKLGCNLNLLDTCPDEWRQDAGTCINPYRDSGVIPSILFKACAATSYTYPNDNLATVSAPVGCENRILCCVGTACAPNPKQELCPGADGHAQQCPSKEPKGQKTRSHKFQMK
ncbi:hypothetical protein HD806DRAFT_519179 [Xylariaceae sp. AK1471]|nr:hypothetical protein HD806DRAFT_519179 [Xylariaceae sp. AK1471]